MSDNVLMAPPKDTPRDKSKGTEQISQVEQCGGRNKFDWEEEFMKFCQQYKDEMQTYKANSKRYCEKIQELEAMVLEQTAALQKTHDLIAKKDKEGDGKKKKYKDLFQKYTLLKKQFKDLETKFAHNEVDYAAFMDQMNNKVKQEELLHKSVVQKQNEEIENLLKTRDELTEKLSKQADIDQLQQQLKTMSQDHAKYIEEVQNSFDEEKLLIVKKYENMLKDLQTQIKEDNLKKNKEIQQLYQSNDDMIGIRKRLEEKCEDLQKQVVTQQQEIAEIKQELQSAAQEHLKKIEELQISFAEQKNLIEAKYEKQIEELKELQKRDIGLKDSFIEEITQQKNLLIQQTNDVINQQTRDITSLQEEVQLLKDNIDKLEKQKHRLVEEHKYRLSTIGRVFSNPVGLLKPFETTTYDTKILKSKITSKTPIHNFFNTKSSNSKSAARKRTVRPTVNKDEVKTVNTASHFANDVNTTVIPARPRAAKRIVDYAALLQSDPDENNESGVTEPQSKQTRTESSERTTPPSEMRFGSEKKTEDVYEFQQEFPETPEEDAFDRLKNSS